MVNVYLCTSLRAPKRQDGKIVIVLEAVLADGKKATKTDQEEVQDMTPNQAELYALVKALRRVKEGQEVTVYTQSGYLYGAMTRGWLKAWKENGWKNIRGKEIRDRSLWEELFSMTERRKVLILQNAEHNYFSWMRWECGFEGG